MPMLQRQRWNYFKDRLIERFGEVVYKIGVDAGFDCPNRDGSKGFGGCAYCSQQGSFSPQQDPKSNIEGQLEKGMWFTQKRYGAKKFIVYFQAFTNTYADPQTLRTRYQSALIDPRIVGMSIATRPDCVNVENIEVLKEFQKKLPFFTVELGLQSAHQNKLEWVNRQESLEDYRTAMSLLLNAEIPVISHIILGFPGESFQEMLDTVNIAQECGSMGLKLQMLHVIRGTKLAHMYAQNPFSLMSFDDYLELIVELIQHIDPKIEIHRISGETEEKSLVAPEWVRHKTRLFDAFDRILLERNLWQGKKRNLGLTRHSDSTVTFDACSPKSKSVPFSGI